MARGFQYARDPDGSTPVVGPCANMGRRTTSRVAAIPERHPGLRQENERGLSLDRLLQADLVLDHCGGHRPFRRAVHVVEAFHESFTGETKYTPSQHVCVDQIPFCD